MLSTNGLKRGAQSRRIRCFPTCQRRGLHYDGRNRLSNFWTPTRRKKPKEALQDGHALLVQAGFLRPAHSGIFHLLPLGLRVQNKIERLIDKHMQRLGASKVSLSSFSSEELWDRSGRLDKGRTSELFQLRDRKGAKYLLSPTHEEEITTIVTNAIKSYKDLPLRLYQVSRKYRDEPRPRQGLLRGREFLMKDLYTFDATENQARQTYEDVRKAYMALLDEVRLPYLVARADSGNMGGNLSHEYHFASPQGEDTIIRCDTCEYSLNEELYIGRPSLKPELNSADVHSEPNSEHYVSKSTADTRTLCRIYYPQDCEPNIYAVKEIFPELDPRFQGLGALEQYNGSLDSAEEFRDPRLPDGDGEMPTVNGEPILLTKARTGDSCPNCKSGKLHLHKAIEIGHTFHLGTRYSLPFESQVLDANNKLVFVQMGCHGIGVSRLIGAIASLLKDSKGLNWPFAISPFDVVIVPAGKTEEAYRTDQTDVVELYDRLTTGGNPDANLDVVIDDQPNAVGWKLADADLIGYPFIVVMGNAWKDRGVVELQCRRLGVKIEVSADELAAKIREYSKEL